MKYIIDTKNFKGTILAKLTDDVHTNGSGQTFDEYARSINSDSLRLVTKEEFDLLRNEYIGSLYTPFTEITEDEYYTLINNNPIRRSYLSKAFAFFYVGETTSLNTYTLCVEYKDRYYKAIKDLNIDKDDIQYRIEYLHTVTVYDLESASHCPILYNYITENHIPDILDLFDKNPEIIKFDDNEIPFTHLKIGVSDIVIYKDNDNVVEKRQIETILFRFFSDDFRYFFDFKDPVWSEFTNNCIAYRKGIHMNYSIWHYKY